MIARRAVLAGLAAAGSSLAPPVLAEQGPSKIARLADELSLELACSLRGTFCAVVKPADSTGPIVSLQPTRIILHDGQLLAFLKGAKDRDLAEYHAKHATMALQRMHGGAWQLTIGHRLQFMTATGGWNYPSGFYQRFV